MSKLKLSSSAIQRRILVPFVACISIITGFILVMGLLLKSEMRNANVYDELDVLQKTFDFMLEKDAELLEAKLSHIVRDKGLQQAWRTGDREVLYQTAAPVFERLKAKYRFSHFYFFTPDQVTFLRLHKPGQYGDLIQRHTLRQAVATGKLAWGLELGKFGNFTLRVVAPWHVDGELTGYVELGEEIDHITRQLGTMLQGSIDILIHKSRVSREQWEKDRDLVSWDLFDNMILVDQFVLNPDLDLAREVQVRPALRDFMKKVEQDHSLSLYFASDKFVVGRIPLHDATGQKVGHIFWMDNIEETIRAIDFSVMASILVSACLGLAAFLFFSIYSRRLGQGIEAIHGEIASPDFSHPLKQYQES